MNQGITRVGLTHLRIPFKTPLRTPRGEVTVKDAILVSLETGDGRLGLGECSPMADGTGPPGSSPSGCWRDLTERIGPSLLERCADHSEAIASTASQWVDCSPLAVAGAETALWDLLGQARHASIAEILGATIEAVARGVESGLKLGVSPTVVDLLRSIELHLDEGYRRVKIAIQPGHDVEFVRAIRDHFGDIPLMVDAHASYTEEDEEIFLALDDEDLLMIEQPYPADQLSSLARLQKKLNTPICLDETADSPVRLAEAIRLGAGKIVNLKIPWVGGLGPAKKLHDLCMAHGVACWVGTLPELGIGQMQAIHLGALPNCKYPADIAPSARWFVDDYTLPRIEFAPDLPGLFRVPTRPGLGCQINAAMLKHYAVTREEIRL